MNVTSWWLLACSLLLLACEKSLPFPEASSSVLVANAIVSADTLWQVQLTQSAALGKKINFPVIDNGQVIIKDLTQGTSIELIPQGNGIYTSESQLPKINTAYQLKAMAEGYPTIQATNMVPDKFNVKLNSFVASTYQQRSNYIFDFTIEDAQSIDNFYLIKITYQVNINGLSSTESAGHFSFDPNSENEQIISNHIGLKQSYLPDHNFNGQNYTTQIGASSPLLEQIDFADKVIATISIKSISTAGYQYEQSVEQFENIEETLFSDPIGVFSNIENGLGIFAGYTEQKIIIPIKN